VADALAFDTDSVGAVADSIETTARSLNWSGSCRAFEFPAPGDEVAEAIFRFEEAASGMNRWATMRAEMFAGALRRVIDQAAAADRWTGG